MARAGHARDVLRDVGLVREQFEMRRHEPETHQSDAGANQGEKCSCLREVDRKSVSGFDAISISPPDDRQARVAGHRGQDAPLLCQYTRHTGNDLGSIALIVPILRLKPPL